MSSRPTALFINRESSWLEFDRRVLEEAGDAKNPVLDRLRFFCIFHSNLDEFFMVRVASLLRRITENDTRPDASGLTPYKQLELIRTRVRELEESSYELYNAKLLPALAKSNIRILAEKDLTAAHQRYLDSYFENEVYPVLTPLAIEHDHPMPHLLNLAVNLAVVLAPEGRDDAPRRLAFVPVPGRLPGLCRLPESGEIVVCWLSDVIRRRVSHLFLGYRIVESSPFRITRDAEMELDDEGGADFVRMLETELRKRRTASPIRVEFDSEISPDLQSLLRERLGVEEEALLPVKGPLDTRPLNSLAEMPGFDDLRFSAQPAILPAIFEPEKSIFDIIRDKDVLLHHPYDSFDPVIEFIRAASEDPDVLAIKQTLYRVSGASSPILRSLVKAAENGKQVTVLVELTARFDEESNIGWARDLEQAGAHVLYGLAGLKVHAKILLIVRREPRGIRRYVHLGTGNYNERTARLYSDFALLTSAQDFGSDASGFFNAITGYSEPPEFRRLVMAPAGLRARIITLIRRETERAKAGQASGITAKMNSLVDPLIIQELAAADQAGVPIRLVVRGICCLRPGVSGHTEHIRVISIVDRYLEHGRAFVFANGGSTEVYLTSADWMPRNLDRRVELLFPVHDSEAKEKVIASLEAELADNQKSRTLLHEGTYKKVSPGRAEPLRVQEFLYRRHLEELERARSAAPVRLVPLERKHS